MICFDVEINGQKFARTGLQGTAVLSSILTWVIRKDESAGRLFLELGGYDTNSEPGVHVGWGVKDLGAGDTVTVKILEADNPDPPLRHEPRAPEKRADSLRAELKAVERRRKQLEGLLAKLEPKAHSQKRPRKRRASARKKSRR